MNVRMNLAAAAVAAVLGAASFVSIAHADAAAASASATPAATSAPATATTVASAEGVDTDGLGNAAVLKTADEAARALREIHQARLALFEGETDAAAKLISAASGNLGAAHDLLAQHALDLSSARGTDSASGKAAEGLPTERESWLPIETSVSLAEGFVPAEQHKGALADAGEKMAQGDQKGAVEALRLADIEVAVSAAVMPLESSLQHVEEAARMFGQGQYFEAGLQLKAIEDAVVIETWSAAAVPVQGTADRAAPAGTAAQSAPQG